MKPMSRQMLYIRAFLSNRPFFFSFIRPTEAGYFYHYRDMLQQNVLDFGCGDGFFLSAVFPEAEHIAIGVDVKDSRMEEAEGLRTYSKLVSYDGDVLPFRTGEFETVISNSVLEHVPNVEQSVVEMLRVLQPGGKLLVSVMTTNWERPLIGAWLFGAPYRRWLARTQVHVSLHSPKDWTKLFEAAGFEVIGRHGYLSPSVIRWMELAHYLSWPSLIVRILTGRWVWPVWWYRLFNVDRLVSWVLSKTETSFEEAGSIFLVLRKPS